MYVPAPKNKTNPNGERMFCFRYTPSNKLINILVPVQTVVINFTQHYNSSVKDFQKRIDLLPFYIDDGKAGRTIYNGTSSKYHKKEYLSFLEAACKLYSSADKSKTQELGFECTNASVEAIGALKVENPRKAF